jgi:hypothetical protein
MNNFPATIDIGRAVARYGLFGTLAYFPTFLLSAGAMAIANSRLDGRPSTIRCSGATGLGGSAVGGNGARSLDEAHRAMAVASRSAMASKSADCRGTAAVSCRPATSC